MREPLPAPADELLFGYGARLARFRDDHRVHGLAQAPPRNSFIIGVLLPLVEDDSAWLASGTESFHPESEARQVARLATMNWAGLIC